MVRLLVVHGAGMELRGIQNIETFGTMTMADYTEAIHRYARELDIHAQVFHSLKADALIEQLRTCASEGIQGVLINPAGFTVGHPEIAQAIRATGLASAEVHVSNPATRSLVSSIAPGTTSVVAGFGVAGYRLAMLGLRELILAPR